MLEKQNKYMSIIAKILSGIFHPLFLPTIGMIIILYSGTFLSNLIPEAKRLLIGIIFITTFIFPLISLSILRWQRFISSFSLEERKERLLPMLTTLMYYYIAYYIINTNHIQGIIKEFILSVIIALTISFFLTLKWKVSLHMIGVGGIMALIISISLKLNTNLSAFLIIWTFIAGLIGSARLYLNMHNLRQIALGFVTGFSAVLLTILLY